MKVDTPRLLRICKTLGWSYAALARSTELNERTIRRLFKSGVTGLASYGLILEAVRSQLRERGFHEMIPDSLELGEPEDVQDASKKTTGATTEVQFVLPIPLEEVTPSRLERIQTLINQEIGRMIDPDRYEEGSVRITYRASKEEAEKLREAFESGRLVELGVDQLLVGSEVVHWPDDEQEVVDTKITRAMGQRRKSLLVAIISIAAATALILFIPQLVPSGEAIGEQASSVIQQGTRDDVIFNNAESKKLLLEADQLLKNEKSTAREKSLVDLWKRVFTAARNVETMKGNGGSPTILREAMEVLKAADDELSQITDKHYVEVLLLSAIRIWQANVQQRFADSPSGKNQRSELLDQAVGLSTSAIGLLESLPTDVERNLRLGMAHYSKARTLWKIGRLDEAVQSFELAFDGYLPTGTSNRFTANMANNLALYYAQEAESDAQKCLKYAQHAHAFDNKSPAFLHTLAIAQSQNSDFNSAVANAKKSLESLPPSTPASIRTEVSSHLRQFQNGKPVFVTKDQLYPAVSNSDSRE